MKDKYLELEDLAQLEEEIRQMEQDIFGTPEVDNQIKEEKLK